MRACRALGIAQDCLDRSVRYARSRIVHNQEIGRFQLVQSMITDMVVGIETARAMTRDYAEKRDSGLRGRREASLAKMHASDVAMMASTHACQIHGAYGTHEDYHVGRHFRDAKVFPVVEGQNQLHRPWSPSRRSATAPDTGPATLWPSASKRTANPSAQGGSDATQMVL